MTSDLHQTILDGLDTWIELIQHTACVQKDNVEGFEIIRSKISSDPDSVHLLADGNIWGGMGSFVDSAYLNIFHYKPTASDPRQRAEQWEFASKKCHSWTYEFNLATIKLGNAIIKFCAPRNELDAALQKSMQRWIDSAKMSNEQPKEPLNQISIDVLESNLRRGCAQGYT